MALAIFIPMQTPVFAEVVLPLALRKNYTYRIPTEWADQATPGKRVVVQFGRKKIYTGLIWALSHTPPTGYTPKDIEQIIDEDPIIVPQQRKLWTWMADYYLCQLGDVMNAALPAGLKMESETRITLHPFFDNHYEQLTDDEYMVAEALSVQHELKIKDIQDLLGKKTVYPIIRSLLDQQVIFLQEELQGGYKPKTETYLTLGPDYQSDESRQALFGELERAPKQMDILLNFFHLQTLGPKVSKSELLAATGKNYSALNRMIEKGIFSAKEEEVSRLQDDGEAKAPAITFSPAQQATIDSIQQHWQEKDVVLLHGVTSSGKTEIYAHLIQEQLEKGKQVLYLLPEIALTGQMIQRLRKLFGSTIGVYHSRFNAAERVEVWHKMYKGEYKVMVGARSALLLPYPDLGLVIVDEEHDRSYKQFDPAPRYNARDTAILLASLYPAKVLLGSATPSVESYYNARQGKYGFVELKERYGNIQLPDIKLLDVSKSARVNNTGTHLSEALVEKLREVLSAQQQAILFRNRRGYAPMLICGTCGHIPQCQQCDVSLTYHKHTDQLKCHYCGYKIKTVVECPACGAHHMRVMGFGTEKIEDELKLLFDDLTIQRLDLDAVKGKHGHQEIINRFATGKIDVLVGTQMVTKGLDFEKVALVGILNADQLLFYPDFRSNERAFQLMVQVAGRSGRKHQRGQVLIQARNLSHPVLYFVINNDYEGFFERELAERHKFVYPPLVRIINLHIRHKDKDRVNQAAWMVYRLLHQRLGDRVYQPVIPSIGRLRGNYLMDIMIKLERKANMLHKVRDLIHEAENRLAADKQLKRVTLYADADPY